LIENPPLKPLNPPLNPLYITAAYESKNRVLKGFLASAQNVNEGKDKKLSNQVLGCVILMKRESARRQSSFTSIESSIAKFCSKVLKAQKAISFNVEEVKACKHAGSVCVCVCGCWCHEI